MSEVRRIYRVNSADLGELNRVLADMSDRLDQMEGFRDNPHFRATPNMGGNKVTNAREGTESTDVAVKGQLEMSYPVGALFFCTASANPGELLGFGTWESFGAGRVLVGVDPSDPDFDAGDTGGAKTHMHSTPAHQHPDGETVDNDGALSTVQVNDASGGSGTTGSSSSMPPYISVFIWERTA